MGRWTETKCDALLLAKVKKMILKARDADYEESQERITYEQIVREMDVEHSDLVDAFKEVVGDIAENHLRIRLLDPTSRRPSSSRLIANSSRTLNAAMERQQSQIYRHFASANLNEVFGDDDDDDETEYSFMNGSDFNYDCDEDDRNAFLELARAGRAQRNADRNARRIPRNVETRDEANEPSQGSRPIRRIPTRTSTVRPPGRSGTLPAFHEALPGPYALEAAAPRTFAPSPDPFSADVEQSFIAGDTFDSGDSYQLPGLAAMWQAGASAARIRSLGVDQFVRPLPSIADGPGERSRNFARRGGATTRASGRTGRSQPAVVISSPADLQRDEFERSATARRNNARRAVEREEGDRRESNAPVAGPSGTTLLSLEAANPSAITVALDELVLWLSHLNSNLAFPYTADPSRAWEATRASQHDFTHLRRIIDMLSQIVGGGRYDVASIQPQITRYLAMIGQAVTTFISTLPSQPGLTSGIWDWPTDPYQIPDWQALMPPGAATNPSTSGTSAEVASRRMDNVIDDMLGVTSRPVTLAGNQPRSHESASNNTTDTAAAYDDDDLATQAASLLESAREARENVMALIDDSRDLVEDGGS